MFGVDVEVPVEQLLDFQEKVVEEVEEVEEEVEEAGGGEQEIVKEWCPLERWATFQQIALDLGLGDPQKLGVVE
jgi:hypothetical protein